MVLEILYSRSQIPRLARWNLLCVILWSILYYYIIKSFFDISTFIIIIAVFLAIYICNLKLNGYLCIRKVKVDIQIKPVRKAVLITGCDTGFGFHIAKRLSTNGFQVFACCLSPFQNGGQQLGEYSNIHTLRMDVTKEEDIILALDFVNHHLGKNELWAVINNAGISKGSEIEVTSMSHVEEVLNVNLLGTIRVTKVFLPLLRKSKGRIINIASAAGRFSMAGFLPYSISKNSVIWFSDGLRIEIAKFGVSVITIEPWVYKTRLSDPSTISKHIEKQWTTSKEDNPKKHSDKHIKQLKNRTKNLFTSIMNSNIDEVIDVMEDAVTRKCPPYIYRPGHFYLNVFLWMLQLFPKPVSDYILCYFVFKRH